MTKTLSDQLGKDGITMNVVHPGGTRTESTEIRRLERASTLGITPEELEARSSQNVAIKRTVDAHELAYVVTFLASPKAECITGEAIGAGGGSMGSVFQ
jgi:NAD(P)-dependent dehydrogenase (short-subunit alcohol dehydrogenase family)